MLCGFLFVFIVINYCKSVLSFIIRFSSDFWVPENEELLYVNAFN